MPVSDSVVVALTAVAALLPGPSLGFAPGIRGAGAPASLYQGRSACARPLHGLAVRRRVRPGPTWLAQTKMPGPGDDKPIDVEVAKDSMEVFSDSFARQQINKEAFDKEAMQAGFEFSRQLDMMQQQQQFDEAFRQPQAASGLQIPWGSILAIGLGLGVLTGKLNIFTLIGEAVSGAILFTIGVPLVLAGGAYLYFKTQSVQGTCPSCASDVTLIKNQAIPCLNCGTMLILDNQGQPTRAAGGFNTEVDERTGMQTVVKDVYDVEATDLNEDKK